MVLVELIPCLWQAGVRQARGDFHVQIEVSDGVRQWNEILFYRSGSQLGRFCPQIFIKVWGHCWFSHLGGDAGVYWEEARDAATPPP